MLFWTVSNNELSHCMNLISKSAFPLPTLFCALSLSLYNPIFLMPFRAMLKLKLHFEVILRYATMSWFHIMIIKSEIHLLLHVSVSATYKARLNLTNHRYWIMCYLYLWCRSKHLFNTSSLLDISGFRDIQSSAKFNQP